MPEYFMIPQKPSEPGSSTKITNKHFSRGHFFFQHAQKEASMVSKWVC